MTMSVGHSASSAEIEIQAEDVPGRMEPRQAVVHVVEYSHYPRRAVGEARRVAYTQDRSASGLGLDLAEALEPNELLNVALRDIDATHSVEGLARVVWCRAVEGGRFRVGLALLREKGKRPMLRVRGRRRFERNDSTFGSR